jgi:hypothetical protein
MKNNAFGVWMALGILVLLVSARERAWAARPDKSYTGIVNYYDPKGQTLNMQGAIFDKEFSVSPACPCQFPGHGQGAVKDLRPGENVTIRYQRTNGVFVADQIEQNLMQYEGVVDDVNGANHTVTVYSRHLDRTFNFAGHCQVVLLNHKSGVFTNLQNGFHVLVTFESPNGTPTAQRIEQTSILFTGSLKEIDLAKGILKARAGFGVRQFSLAKDCTIRIHGKTAQLADFKPDDKLVLTYDTVNGVNVVNRIVPAGEAANVVKLDEYKIDL